MFRVWLCHVEGTFDKIDFACSNTFVRGWVVNTNHSLIYDILYNIAANINLILCN